MFLTGSAAAASIAWINSIGNLGGFFGPTIVGWAKQITGSYAGGLYALAALALKSAIVSLVWLDIPRRIARPGVSPHSASLHAGYGDNPYRSASCAPV